jgi:hypothetical protein
MAPGKQADPPHPAAGNHGRDNNKATAASLVTLYQPSPNLGRVDYNRSLADEVYFGPIFPGKLLDFAPPIDSFAIKRINTYNKPGAPRQKSFLAGISFQDLRHSPVTVIQTPLVKHAPDPSPSVPGPLPVLGIGGAFGWSRQLRRRLRQQGEASQCRT